MREIHKDLILGAFLFGWLAYRLYPQRLTFSFEMPEEVHYPYVAVRGSTFYYDSGGVCATYDFKGNFLTRTPCAAPVPVLVVR